MVSGLKRGLIVLALSAALSACTSPFQSHLIPPGLTTMDATPCPTCDSGGGMPGKG